MTKSATNLKSPNESSKPTEETDQIKKWDKVPRGDGDYGWRREMVKHLDNLIIVQFQI